MQLELGVTPAPNTRLTLIRSTCIPFEIGPPGYATLVGMPGLLHSIQLMMEQQIQTSNSTICRSAAHPYDSASPCVCHRAVFETMSRSTGCF
jgi:hypothetical protein